MRQELDGCSETLIGDELVNMKGISGGQRRRVSVGMELVKDPGVLFLDEPTSGLDSEIAGSLMEMLVRLARSGRTVVVTIHQPNSLITSLFDDFMLLSGGRLVYGGAWSAAVDAFAAAGHACPRYINPTDHFMTILRDADATSALVDAQTVAYSSGRRPWGTDERASVGMPGSGKGGEGDAGSGTPVPHHAGGPTPEVAFWYQCALLVGRMVRMWLRNPTMLMSELSQYAFLAVFVGLMYLRVGDSADAGARDRVASIWFSMAILSFVPSYTALTVWDRERVLLRREIAQGMYGVTAWYTARTLTVTPFQIAQTTLYALVTFFMVGYWASAAKFFIYYAAYALFMLVSETIGMLAAILTRNSTYAVLVSCSLLMPAKRGREREDERSRAYRHLL